MRRVIGILVLAVVLGQSGCGEDPPAMAPQDFRLVVEFVPTSGTFSNDGDVAAILTNRSRGKIYVGHACPTQLERQEQGQWVVAQLSLRFICFDDAPPPYPISPGESVQFAVRRIALDQPILPGVYRFPVKIGKAEALEWHWSAEFTVTD